MKLSENWKELQTMPLGMDNITLNVPVEWYNAAEEIGRLRGQSALELLEDCYRGNLDFLMGQIFQSLRMMADSKN